MVFDKGLLPPGYKFQPTNKQIIQDYLVPKVQNTLNDVSWFIFEKNIYDYANPFLLFQEIQRNQGYFFTPISKVSSSGKNVKRKTGEGKWRGEKPTPLCDDDNKVIGIKRMYTFEWNVPEGKTLPEVKREKGHWIMHEYSLLPNYYTENNIKTDPEYVLCEIRSKIPIDVNAVREEQRQSQPIAKRQRTSMSSPTTDTMPAVEPPINNGSSMTWVPSLLPAETSVSQQFMDAEAAPIFNNMGAEVPPLVINIEDSPERVPLQPQAETDISEFMDTDLASILCNAESSEWVPSPSPAKKSMDPYVSVPVPEPPATLLPSMPDLDVLNIFSSWDPSLLPAETTTSMGAAVPPLVINVEDSPERVPLQPQAETDIPEFMDTDLASIFCNAESSEWVPSPATLPPLVPDFDEFLNGDEWGNLFSLDDLLPAPPTSEDNFYSSTPPDNNYINSLEADLKGSNNYVQQEEYNYWDSRKVLKVSDAEAKIISKLGWDPVAYKANVEAMQTTCY